MQDRVVEAKEELERALALQPQDAKGQDLLAGVYFRLGVYPRAIEIWQALVETYSRDATLRVNLALALLKTGQPTQAMEHIHVALQVSPDHERAWGYLGLTHWRLGNFQDARDAFLRGGQGAMARRMEAVLGADAEPAAGSKPGADEFASDRAAMRSAAEQAIQRFEAEQVTLEPANRESKITGSWRVAEPGEEQVPHIPPPFRQLPVTAAPRLDAVLESWSVSLPEEVPLAVGADGALHLYTRGDIYARLSGLRAVRGALRTTPVQRRARGRELDEILGVDDPIFLWRGPVSAVIHPPKGRSYHAVSLDDDVLYVLEESVAAFDDRLGFESGRLPLRTGPLVMLQLYGSGTVVLALEKRPAALRVSEGEEVHVVPSALVGWTGRLLPRGKKAGGTEPYSIATPPLSFRGDGVVLVN